MLTTAVKKATVVSNSQPVLVAGSNGTGSNDGQGASATFNTPLGVVIDTTGNAYVCDSSNHTIRKVTVSGVTSIYAGAAGSSGSADGTSAARFNSPRAIAIDSNNNLYVADYSNNSIRKIAPSGTPSTTSTLFTVPNPNDVAVSPSGTLITAIANTGNILYASINGTAGKVGPTGASGQTFVKTTSSALLPISCAVPDDTSVYYTPIYIGTQGNDRTIQKITLSVVSGVPQSGGSASDCSLNTTIYTPHFLSLKYNIATGTIFGCSTTSLSAFPPGTSVSSTYGVSLGNVTNIAAKNLVYSEVYYTTGNTLCNTQTSY